MLASELSLAVAVQDLQKRLAKIEAELPESHKIVYAGGGGVSMHNELMGLDADDHTQYLPLTGIRAMTGDFNLGGKNLQFSTNILLSYLDINTLRLTDPTISYWKSLAVGSLFLNGNLRHTGNVYLKGDDYNQVFDFQSYDNVGNVYVTNARNPFNIADGFQIPRAGDISLLDGKFLHMAGDFVVKDSSVNKEVLHFYPATNQLFIIDRSDDPTLADKCMSWMSVNSTQAEIYLQSPDLSSYVSFLVNDSEGRIILGRGTKSFEFSTINGITSLGDDNNFFFGIGEVTSLPTADSEHRGKLIRVEGGAGVADILYCCMKSAADTYSWVQVASG